MAQALAGLVEHFAVDQVDGLELGEHPLIVKTRQRREQAVGGLGAAEHQRALRIGQEVRGAGRRVEHRVDLARVERAALRSALHQLEDAAVHLMPRAASTPARSLRLPTIFAAGDGESLARCGVTRMPSASARSGDLRTSTISSLKADSRCSWQIAARLAMARTELGAPPATYRRSFIMRLPRVARAIAAIGLRLIAAADAAQLLLALAGGDDARFVVARILRELAALARQIVLHRLDARAGVGLAHLQLAALVVELGAALPRLAALLVLLLPAQRAHQHLAAGAVDVRQHRAAGAEDQLAHLVRVPGAARLDDSQRAVALAAADHVGKVDPGIGDGRDLQVGRLGRRIIALVDGGDEYRDALVLHHVDQAGRHRARPVEAAGLGGC